MFEQEGENENEQLASSVSSQPSPLSFSLLEFVLRRYSTTSQGTEIVHCTWQYWLVDNPLFLHSSQPEGC